MRIGESYGLRLNSKFGNLRDGGVEVITQSYPSHGFVIDLEEVERLFHRVREATDSEKALVEKLGRCCRFPESELMMACVTEEMASIEGECVSDEQTGPRANEGLNGNARHREDPAGAGEGKRAAPGERPDEASPETQP